MNPDHVLEMILEMSVLKGFPFESAAGVGLVRLVAKWTDSEAEVRGLVDAMLQLDGWPGPRVFRQTFNRLYRPKLLPPDRVPFPDKPLPDWFIEWQGARLELAAGDGPVKTTEELAARVKELAAGKPVAERPRRSNVHTMPAAPRVPYVRSAEEQSRLDAIAADIERVQAERKRGA